MNPQKPTIVTVIAIFGVIFGFLGLFCCMPIHLIQIFAPEPAQWGAVTIPAPVYSSTEMALLIFSQILFFPASIALLVGSLGSWLLKPWAWWCMIAYGVLAILGNLCFNAGNIVSANAQSQVMLQALFPGAPAAPAGPVTLVIGVITGTFCNSLFAILTLVAYSTPTVRRAFSGTTGSFGPPPGGFPPGSQGPWQQQPMYPQYPQYPPQYGGYQPPYNPAYPPGYPPAPQPGAYPQPPVYGDPNVPPPLPPQSVPPPPPSYPPYPNDENLPPPPPNRPV